jgi:ferredoxin
MRGCTACSIHAIRRFRGDDKDLITLYERAKDEVEEYLQATELSKSEQVAEIMGEGS